MDIHVQDIIRFWFCTLTPAHWFMRSQAIDNAVQYRFTALHTRAQHGELFTWRNTPLGRLAEIIVLDQFSRNIFRGRASAFAADGMALVLAQEAVALRIDRAITTVQKQFLYMPYMHSESLAIQTKSLSLFASLGGIAMQFAQEHFDIIQRFGRFPHRNAVLNRTSRPEEQQFLAQHTGF